MNTMHVATALTACAAGLLSAMVLTMAGGAGRLSDAAKIETREIEYEHNGVKLKGFLAYDGAAKEKRPGVLVVHEWWGHNEYARRRARELAGLGYTAFAVDMYGTGVLAKGVPDAQKLATPFYQDRGLMRGRAAAGLKVLREQAETDAEKLGAIGYCFGGTVVLELARSGADVDAVVSFHGGLSADKPGDAKNIKAKVLVCNGADDPMVPPAERQAFKEEMASGKVDYVFIDYGNAVHAFTNPEADGKNIPGVAYNASADKRSWEHMRAFFKEALGR